ncbi:MAG: ribonuclease J [Candidatus Levybacteria bacterium]|nr:ribonuclease J [Candidatus Levybacteria bacterium]
MDDRQTSRSSPTLSFFPLSGIEDVTKNMYLYEYGDEILIVDCGLGFADETMLGVDLLLPDISYLLQTKKKIVGMVLTHGHEDHIGALPFILPQLPQIPVFATPLTAAFSNEKLKEFRINQKVQTVNFNGGDISLGSFRVSFIRVTHSVPDTANLLIKTPAGTVYHGSDFKFDLTPADKKPTEYHRIAQAGREGVLALVSDCLGAERLGFSRSELPLQQNFENAMRDCRGKVILTTYSSNISRLNQAIAAASHLGRKVCFVGRSLVKAKLVAKKLGLLQMADDLEVPIDRLRKFKDYQLLLIVAGSQGQENSALTRIATDEHREVTLGPQDLVIISSDIIPGNEVLVHSMIDEIAKKGSKVIYRDISDQFHVSGHGTQGDLMLMMSLVNARYVIPISGTYRQMASYKRLAETVGYPASQVILTENGQEIMLGKAAWSKGRKIEVRNVYVDEISGEEVESFVLRDRERLAKEGVVMVLAEVNSATGDLVSTPEVVVKGFIPKDSEALTGFVQKGVRDTLSMHKKKIRNWVYVRRMIEETVGRIIDKELHRRPLILPVLIEV